MRSARLFGGLVAVSCGLTAGLTACAEISPPSRHLLIVLDGLRPDYVTQEIMPNLYALGSQGLVFENHHAVYPTVTRVNASSISTGSYPETHGLMGNSVFVPDVDPTRFLDTGDRGNLLKIADVTGTLLTAPTMGNTLQKVGRRMLVVSAGSTGSSFLVNHTVAGGAVLHHEVTLPESLEEQVRAELGDPLPAGTASSVLNERAVDAFLKIGIPYVDPTVTVIWLTDPDTTAHQEGIGHPTTIESLRAVDGEIGRIEDGLRAADLFEVYNIWVTSDHGFSTYTGQPDVTALMESVLATLDDGSPRVVEGGGAVYVPDGDREIIRRLVQRLQETVGIGAIFTQAEEPGGLDGWAPGTLSFDAVRWQHDRSADILFSPDWSDVVNAYGFRGATASDGVAGHGSSSPYDVHNLLMAAGPDLRRGVTIGAATANVDFAPTFLHLLGAPIPDSMQGRVLEEAFENGPDPQSVSTRDLEHTIETSDGRYRLTAFFSIVEQDGKSYRYLDRTVVSRAAGPT